MKNPNNKKWTQAEKTVHRWTGVRPDQTKAEDTPSDRKNGLQARRILTKGIYAANPELAFGIVRRMLTGNQMRASDFNWFINNLHSTTCCASSDWKQGNFQSRW